MRFPLWQRIFVYTLALLIISQGLAFVLHNAMNREDIRRHFAGTAGRAVAELKGQSLEMVLSHARMSPRGPTNILLTKEDGTALPGMESTQKAFAQSKILEEWNFDGITLMEVDKNPRLWAKALLPLKEGVYWFYMSLGPPPRPLKSVLLFQLFIPVLLASVTLALWMAWSVSRPLRKLRDEVREMSQTGPGCKVTVAGRDEISEVAGAVNAMAEILGKHVQGMHSLVVNVSHELRSPLARANLALGIVEDSLPVEYGGLGTASGTGPECGPECGEGSPENRRDMVVKYLAALQEEMDHMDTLIGTTLLTQKLDLQLETTPMETLDFSALCLNAWNRYKPMLSRNGFTLNADVGEGATVLGNRILLAQMLSNLFDNCLKYTSKNGEISFSVTVRQGNCSVRIENSHESMSETQADHIFDPFYRVDQATGTGIGLGLALVQKTVALHKGNIMAVPTDIGLCICLQLPLATGAN